MKVAVFANVDSPQMGGGYRFQYEIASALLSTSALRHEFYAMIDSASAAEAWRGSAERVIDVRRTRVARGAHRVRRLVSEGARLRLRNRRWWEGSRSFEPFLREQLTRRGIGALLSLQPGVVPILGVPFATLVWDLQHLLQPIFPEVSADGEWEAREAAYRSILPRASAIVTGTERGSFEIQRFYGVAAETVFVVPFPTPEFARKAGGGARRLHAPPAYPLDTFFIRRNSGRTRIMSCSCARSRCCANGDIGTSNSCASGRTRAVAGTSSNWRERWAWRTAWPVKAS